MSRRLMYTEGTLPLNLPVGFQSPRLCQDGVTKVGTWLSLVERTLGVGEVASSNLVVPTNHFNKLKIFSGNRPTK